MSKSWVSSDHFKDGQRRLNLLRQSRAANGKLMSILSRYQEQASAAGVFMKVSSGKTVDTIPYGIVLDLVLPDIRAAVCIDVPIEYQHAVRRLAKMENLRILNLTLDEATIICENNVNGVFFKELAKIA